MINKIDRAVCIQEVVVMFLSMPVHTHVIHDLSLTGVEHWEFTVRRTYRLCLLLFARPSMQHVCTFVWAIVELHL